ncbi:TIGR03862 family flavoprotein [Silanimonas sp.]|uniref:TIGR03862 family flavoprotein n=1 Tax=Silanimonas sp. TaxID=1929290 RepID=UPI0022C854E2|nr:TIGR03862 family flavoprotein [Silanimonas sp.]MCZ8113672.1 TIGR03862 family flavoprotein [Silanimonas sp.]
MNTEAWACPGVAVIGGGPAGLMAAEVARKAGVDVDLFEAKPSVGRKFLIAGRGGLNLTHGDPRPRFEQRYSRGAQDVTRWLDAFDSEQLRAWARELGVETFVGTSGRVFPNDMKAAPLLRAWVARLKQDGVRMHMRQRWAGFDAGGHAVLEGPDGPRRLEARAVVLALGGGSWPQLGSDGAWLPWLEERSVPTVPLEASNCGFDVAWSPFIATKFAGAPLKPVIAHWRDAGGRERQLQGECVLSAHGIEGSLIYAIGPDLRAALHRDGHADIGLDLVPGLPPERVRDALAKPREGRSLSEVLRRRLKLDGAKAALLREVLSPTELADSARLAQAIKRLPLRLGAPRPIAEAISTAGGVAMGAVDTHLGVKALSGWFACGEMLDWDAPTGGYLLTACFASGVVAGRAAAAACRAAATPR